MSLCDSRPQTAARIPGHEHPIVVAIIPNRDNPASSSAVVIDVRLTDRDRSRPISGVSPSEAKHNINPADDVYTL